MKTAVVAGHICLDIIPLIDRPLTLTPGRLFEVGAPTIATGGAVSNTGVAFHILGIPTILMGKVGDDAFGASILKVLAGYGAGLEKGMAVVPGVVSSYTVVVNIPGTDRIFLHCPGANANFTADDVDYAKVKQAALFHFGYPSFMAATYANDAQELIKMYKNIKDRGVTTSLDPGMPDAGGPSGKVDWLTAYRNLLPAVDVFMPSGDELLYALDRPRFGQGDKMTGRDVSPLGARLIDMGCAVVGIKLGSRGMYVRTAGEKRLQAMGAARPADTAAWANRELWFPVYQVEKFVGATGAGDTTIAGFLASLLRGKSLETAGCMANAVGSCNVTAADALSGLLSWEKTEAKLNAGWKHDPFSLADPGWCRNERLGIWHGPGDAGR